MRFIYTKPVAIFKNEKTLKYY